MEKNMTMYDYENTKRYKELEKYMYDNHMYYLCNLDDLFGFGKKYKYNTLRSVLIYDPSYIEWAIKEGGIQLSKAITVILAEMKKAPYNMRAKMLEYGSNVLKEKDEAYRKMLIINTIKKENNKKMVDEWVGNNSLIEWLYSITLNKEIIWEATHIKLGENGIIKGIYKDYNIRVERTGSVISTRYYSDALREITLYVDDVAYKSMDGYEWIDIWNKIIAEIEKQYKEKNNTIEYDLNILPNFGKLSISDVLVYSYDFNCEKNHIVEDVCVIIPVCNTNGERIDITAPAGYCRVCNHYFILMSIYHQVLTYGKPLCQVYENIPQKHNNTSFNTEGLAAESPLHIYGYEVNKESNLSNEQRWAILEEVINENVLTKENIISYLDWFCNTRKRMANMTEAINKWQMDRKHIVDYNCANQRSVIAKSITINSVKC